MELPIFRPNVILVCPRFQEGLAPRMMLTAARDSAVGRLIIFRRHSFGLNISGTGKTMSKSSPPQWLSKEPAISRYTVAILSVAVAAVAAQILTVFLHTEPIASSMISAVMFAAWFGGFAPGLLAIGLALLAFHYYVVPPVNSFTLKHDLFSLGLQELPRLFLFSIAALFVTFLSSTQRRAVESLRRSRDDLVVAAKTQSENEAALRSSQMYLAEAQRLSQTGSFGWNTSSGEIFWSEESFRIFGYDNTPSVTLEMVLERVHPEDKAFVQCTLDRASGDGKDFDYEHRLLMPDGSVKYLHVVAHAVRDRIGILRFVGALMDVTAAKGAEDALRESEQRFRDYTESASDWYWETGPDHRFIAVSDQQFNAIGALPTRRIGTLRWDFARDVEEEPEKWRLHMADLDAHKPFRDFRYRATSRDGSEIYINTSGKPLFDRQGRFLGYRGVSGHITAAVRAALLEEALQEAKVVGDNIAHDLRTPLTRVRIRLERGREHAATLEEFRTVADQAIAGLDQSLTTITALLRITEIEHSRRREGFSDVQLAPLIREAADLYEPIAENKGVILRVDAADGPIVNGDRDLLFEAVANLVDNAVKFTPEGGRVELGLLLQESEIVIRVSDTGPGIPEIEREAVTQRFYRSDQSRNIKGLGLGLSMVAAIIKLHSFRLKISAGAGCTVEITCTHAD
jgi:PAS domain S-box-containing protein